MKRALIVLGGIVALLVVLLIAANLLVSPERLKDRVAERIREQTGRELTVAGSTSMLFLPNPHIVLTDASLTDPNATAHAVDIKVERLEIDLGLIDLISRRVDADRVLFYKPVVLFRPQVGEAAPDRRTELAPPPARGKPAFLKADSAGGGGDKDIRLEDVRIEDGTFRVLEPDGSLRREFRHIDAALSMPHITDPLTAEGKFDLLGRPVNFEATVTTPGALRDKQPADVLLGLSTDIVSTEFQGKVFPGDSLQARGRLVAHSASLKDLIAWRPLNARGGPAIEGDLAGALDWSPDAITLSDMRFAFDQSKGQGRLALSLNEAKPHLRAALAIDSLNLGPFLPDGKLGEAAASAPGSSAKPAPPPPSPEAAGKSAPPDWFTRPGAIDPDSLPPEPVKIPEPGSNPAAPESPLDADINVNIRQTKVNRLTIGPSSLGIRYSDEVMTATLGGMQLYGGEGRGRLTIDTSWDEPVFSADFSLDKVAAGPLLEDAAEFKLLSGETKLILKLKGMGSRAGDIRNSLDGQGSVVLSDGALHGINITRIIADVGEGRMPELNGGKTKFSTLGGTFQIGNGIARTGDLQMNSPLLVVTAAGEVDIPHKSLDILAHPKIVASAEGKGGANDFAGLTIPIRIQGPLDNPTYAPQIAGLFDNPEAATDTVNKLGDAISKKFKGKPVGEAIGRFLGSVKIGGEEPSDQKSR